MSMTPRKDKDLSIRQKRFVEEYVIDGNASKAATTAGYSQKTAKQQGSRLLTNVNVCGEISRRRAIVDQATELTTERILLEVARVSYYDVRKTYNNDGTRKKPHELDDDTAAAVASMETKELFEGTGKQRRLIGYTTEVKPFDKNAALEKAMRHKGLYKKDNEQSENPLVELFKIINADPNHYRGLIKPEATKKDGS